MYKALIIFYFSCFFTYVLFSRVPDFFGADYTNGVVSKAVFLEAQNYPELIVDYTVDGKKLQYKTNMWFLTSYKPGSRVTMIYNPADPAVACIYAFIGYWIKWSELLFTAAFFVVLFLVARSITGQNRAEEPPDPENRKKRKYDE